MRALYELYGAELYGFAFQRLRDRELAEETTQDVFTQAWRKARQFDPERGSVRTWLYGIARNAVVDTWRRSRARPALAEHPPEEPGAVEEPIEQALLRWQVRMALERLVPEHREVLQLSYFEGLTLREIAERTGLPLGTVKSRTSYALQNLRLALEEIGALP